MRNLLSVTYVLCDTKQTLKLRDWFRKITYYLLALSILQQICLEQEELIHILCGQSVSVRLIVR